MLCFLSVPRAVAYLPYVGDAAGQAKIVLTRVDVSDSVQVDTWIADTIRDFGRLDGCANVAGIAGGDGETTSATIVRHHPLSSQSSQPIAIC